MNEVQPLLSFIRGSGMRVPARDDTIPGKQLVLEQCMKEHWRSLLPQQQSLRAHKQQQQQQQVMVRAESGIGPLFSLMDANHDGQVSKEELAEFLRANGHGGEASSEQLLAWLLDAADADHDGLVSLPDLR